MTRPTQKNEGSSVESQESEFPIKSVAGVLIGAAALSMLSGHLDGKKEAPAPADTSKSYLELAADSSQESYNPDTDTILIDGVKVMPKNPKRNTPSEAVMNHPKVGELLAKDPSEYDSLLASSTAIGSLATKIVVVGRDINGDGILDAVATTKSE